MNVIHSLIQRNFHYMTYIAQARPKNNNWRQKVCFA